MHNEETFDPKIAFPDSDKGTIPEAPVRLVKPTKPGQCYTWQVIKCPYCGKEHAHGAGDDLARVNTFLGHRVQHCGDDKSSHVGYYLVPEDKAK